MSQHDYVLDNQNGASFRSDLNGALQAVVTNNAGAAAPSPTFAFMWWPDTLNDLLKIRNAANSAWITVGVLSTINLGLQVADADTAKTDTEQTWTQVQRTNESIGTSLSLNLDNGYLDFKCTPAAGGALTFTNIPATPLVQKGTILFVNGSNYVITAHANTKIMSSDLTKISNTGTYLLSYRTSNGVVYVVSSGALV